MATRIKFEQQNRKTHITIAFQAQWNVFISLVNLNYWWHIYTSIFNLLGVLLKLLFFLGVSLLLNEVLSIGLFGPGLEVMFWLECVTLLLQKSD